MKTLMLSTMVAMLVGCPPPSPPPPAAPTHQGEPLPPPPEEPPQEPASGAPGASCDSAADCESGICEGEGCGPGQGVCASRERACTRDLRPYCGCDGVTFQSSGSCPGKRFAHRGECKTSGATGRADGERCASADQCASGLCEGQGCKGESGVCVSRKRMCTNDLRPYCGCDGETFRTSGSCPGRLYAHRGECRSR